MLRLPHEQINDSKMTDCPKCKKTFEEINLTWKQVDGKLLLLCDECNEKANKTTSRTSNTVHKPSE